MAFAPPPHFAAVASKRLLSVAQLIDMQSSGHKSKETVARQKAFCAPNLLDSDRSYLFWLASSTHLVAVDKKLPHSAAVIVPVSILANDNKEFFQVIAFIPRFLAQREKANDYSADARRQTLTTRPRKPPTIPLAGSRDSARKLAAATLSCALLARSAAYGHKPAFLQLQTR